MKRFVYALCIFGLVLMLFGSNGIINGNSDSEVRMIHFLEVTFPQMEKK